MNKLALRKKIIPTRVSKIKESNARVIILNGEVNNREVNYIEENKSEENKVELEDLNKKVLETAQINQNWSTRYDLKFKKHQKLLEYYYRITELVLNRISTTSISSNLSLRDMISKEVRSALKEESFLRSSDKFSSNKLSREVRRIIVSRLTSLVVNLEPIFEIFKDKEIVRIVISNKLYPRVFTRLDIMTSPKWFVSTEEAKLLVKVLNLMIQESESDYYVITRDQYEFSILLNSINESEISIVRASQKSSVMLDLIRGKFLSPQISRSITKLLSIKGSGLLITGGSNYGKTQLLSATISSLPLNISPLIIGVGDTLKKSHPHAVFIDRSLLLDKSEVSKNFSRDSLEELIIQSGIGIIIIDEINSNILSLLSEIKLKYKIPILASVRGLEIQPTICSLCGYHAEKKVEDLNNFPAIFQFIIELNKGKSSNYIQTILETIPGKGEVKTLPILKAKNQDNVIEWESTGLSSEDGIFNYNVIKLKAAII